MSFHTTIARLREAVAGRPAPGEPSHSCRVHRADLREALHLLDRLDADLRRSGVISQEPTPAQLRTAPPDVLAAVARLTALARETRAIYGQDTCAGGEPQFPTWPDDLFKVARFVRPDGFAATESRPLKA